MRTILTITSGIFATIVRRSYAIVLLLAVVASVGWATPAAAAVCAAATSQGTAPPTWQTYCWLDFTGYNDTTARTPGGQAFSYALSDGAVLSFTLRTTGTPGIVAAIAPSWTGAAVGNTAFLGIPNRPILYQNAGGTTTITLSNILITPPPGAPAVTAYAVVVADAESTNNGESLQFTTNGSAWTILDQVNPISGSTYPTISGANTTTFTETGVAGTVGGYIVGTNSPTTVGTQMVGGGLQGIMFAVRFASIRLNKQIVGGRVNPADQFRFDIRATAAGTTLATGTSTGSGNGPFTAAAVSLASGLPITLVETMAPGSASPLASYATSLTCTNGTAGSTTVLPVNLPVTSYNFGSLQFGDAIQCSFTNTAFPHLTLRKALGAGGRRFDTDQFTVSIRNGAATVASATTTGVGTTVTTGTTPQIMTTLGTTYTVNEVAAAGSLAQYTQGLACTNAAPASPTVLPTTLPGSVAPIMGDVISCIITNTRRAANATLTMNKISALVSDPISGAANPFAVPGAIVRYGITVANTGSLAVDSSSIFILDPLPAMVSFDNSTPVSFTNGAVASGLTFNAATDVRFSNAGSPPANFAACNYTPAAGVDANVRYVCIRPSGTMAGATGAGQPSFTVAFNVAVQ